MNRILLKALCLAFVLVIFSSLGHCAFSQVSGQPPASQVTPDQWPKTSTIKGAEYTIYQPQLDDWDGYNLNAHAAVSVLEQGAKEPVFGVINFSAKTSVDRIYRTVNFSSLKTEKAIFPTAPASADKYQKAFHDIASKGSACMSLDSLQAQVGIISARKHADAVPVKNTPPAFIFSQQPAILVSIDGDPAWTDVHGTSLKRVYNTRAFIVKDSSGTLYMHLFDGFIEASNLNGPWQVSSKVPKSVSDSATNLAKQNIVDLMTGEANTDTGQMPMLKNAAPTVFTATAPTELIVTDGQPNWTAIKDTRLLYVSNTTGNIFKSLDDQNTYVLVTGRWFKAADLAGPWQYVPGNALPSDFARIPDNSPKENVKASIPGTPQAQESLISNSIPQTAAVSSTKAKFTPAVSGTPSLKPIDGTSLYYVANSITPIIKVDYKTWYACQNGVWFTSNALNGQWIAATSVPAVIYSIPPSSPLYYVTHVKIFNVVGDTIMEGYTPGYMGTAVSTDGSVVYGTGYDYDSYLDDTTWYPSPLTYGYAADPTWTPWTGWAFAFGEGWALCADNLDWGWGWGAAPYWGAVGYNNWGWDRNYGNYGYARGERGAVGWGPNGWAATSGNVYHHWGDTGAVSRTTEGYNAWTGNSWSSKVGHSYNSVTGQISAGQRGSVQNVYTGNYAYGARGATYNPSTGANAAGERATVGNPNTGRQETVGKGEITGPGGQTTHLQQVGNNVYGEHDGNVYKDTGSGFQKLNADGSWNNVTDKAEVQNIQDHQAAREAGASRTASSSWGGHWGGGFGGGENRSEERSFGGRGGWSGGGFGGFHGGFGGFHGGGGRR